MKIRQARKIIRRVRRWLARGISNDAPRYRMNTMNNAAWIAIPHKGQRFKFLASCYTVRAHQGRKR